MPDEIRGLYGKYRIERVDGKPMKPGFRFLLSPENDPAALEALKAYAKSTKNRILAADLAHLIYAIEKEKVINSSAKR